jgi:hypothetical protein
VTIAAGTRRAVAAPILAALMVAAPRAFAADPPVAPNAPQDSPDETLGRSEVEALVAALKPAMEMARQTYPAARTRFLRGLPARHSFFVVTRLPVPPDGIEQVFVAVDRIEDGRIIGRIWSEIVHARRYKRGDRYSLPESQVVDWLITRPDGSEEGNYVGKAIDRIQAERRERQPQR